MPETKTAPQEKSVEMTFLQRLGLIQAELKAPKDLNNSFGGFKYRSNESILEAVKPLLIKYDMVLTQVDELVLTGDRYYIRAISTLEDIHGQGTKVTTALAREDESKKGMDASQVTGATSSYARKYSLNGMFLIDDTKDADSDEHHKQRVRTPNQPSKPAGTLPSSHPPVKTSKPLDSKESSHPAVTPAQNHLAVSAGKATDLPCEIHDCKNTVWASKAEKTRHYHDGHIICYFHSKNSDWRAMLNQEDATPAASSTPARPAPDDVDPDMWAEAEALFQQPTIKTNPDGSTESVDDDFANLAAQEH